MVIPAMDFINDKLTAHAHNRSLSPAIRASLNLGKKTMNRYYSLTDASEVYRIAMSTWLVSWLIFLTIALLIPSQSVLHPRHKLTYFKTSV